MLGSLSIDSVLKQRTAALGILQHLDRLRMALSTRRKISF